MKKKEKKLHINEILKRIIQIFEAIIDYIVLVPLTIIAIILICQSIVNPDKVPNVFGYKIFMIMDENMDESLQYGDLVFTKNIVAEEVKIGDLVAFRNEQNKITIHKVIEIGESLSIDEDSKMEIFTMETLENEDDVGKNVSGDRIEGKVIRAISKIGLIIMIIQEPLVTFIIIIFILIIGLIIYYIAQELDLRDIRLKEEINKKEDNNMIIKPNKTEEKVSK